MAHEVGHGLVMIELAAVQIGIFGRGGTGRSVDVV